MQGFHFWWQAFNTIFIAIIYLFILHKDAAKILATFKFYLFDFCIDMKSSVCFHMNTYAHKSHHTKPRPRLIAMAGLVYGSVKAYVRNT